MSTQQSSQLSSAAARSAVAHSSRPILHERQIEIDDDASLVGSPLNLTAIERARPFLLFRAVINLDDSTEEWEDRSNRPANSAAVNALVESYRTRNVKRNDPSTRILYGVRREQFDSLFPQQNLGDLVWLGLWRPRDDANTTYQILNWGPRPKIQLIAGQHRKLALKIHEPDNFTWVANFYDLDAIPQARLIELGGNASTVAQSASMGEVFRDMAAVAPHLAEADTIIVRPHLNSPRAPTVDEYLTASRNGDKSKLQKTFTTLLSVCSQFKNSIDKLLVVLASP